MENNSFFYIFVFVIAIAIGYVVYAMYSLPQLGENDTVRTILSTKQITFTT